MALFRSRNSLWFSLFKRPVLRRRRTSVAAERSQDHHQEDTVVTGPGARDNRGFNVLAKIAGGARRRRPIVTMVTLAAGLAMIASAGSATLAASTADAQIVQCPDPTMLSGPPGPSAIDETTGRIPFARA